MATGSPSAQARPTSTESDAADPRQSLLTPRRPAAVAGPYRLVAAVWNELVRVENGVRHYIKHFAGDVVELNVEQAARLLKHGAVEPTTEEQEQSPAAQQVTPLAKARVISAQSGPTPANDASAAPAAVYPAQSSSPLS